MNILKGRFVGTFPSPDGYVDVKAVITDGQNDDVAVYVGIGTDEWVAANGRKCKFQEATMYFPTISQWMARTRRHYRK